MTLTNLIAASLIAAMTLPVGLAAAQTHDHAAGGELVLVLNEGHKWQGDESMRKGMDGIRSAIATRQTAIHDGTLSAAEYDALAGEVQSQVDFMVENCVLEPAVDEQLHAVLGQVLQGVSDIENDKRPEGAVLIVEALNAYGDHFEHPGWQPVE